MSHNTTVTDVKITDLAALQAAVDELVKEGAKIRLDVNAKRFRTYQGVGNDETCDAAIILEGERYDVGLKRNEQGEYVPVFDNMMLANNKAIACDIQHRHHGPRAAIGRLMQRYTVCLTEKEMALQGHMCTRQVDKETGEINIIAEY